MLTEEQRLERAARAQAELTLTDAILDEMRAKLIDRWAGTGIDHVATREKLFLAVQNIDAFRGALKRCVTDGQVLKHTAEMAALLAPAEADRR
jgi:hypothetical protein